LSLAAEKFSVEIELPSYFAICKVSSDEFS
jgi:hypothetical protein